MIARRFNKNIFLKSCGGGIDDNTVLMLHCEDFTDSSPRGHSVGDWNSNDTQFVSGKFGKAFSFSPMSFVYCANSSDFNFGTSDFTIDFWLYCNVAWENQDSYCPLGSQKMSGDNGWIIYRDKNSHPKQICFFGNQHQVYSVAAPATQVWEHWAFVRKDGTLRFYRNGKIDSEHSFNYEITDYTNDYFRISGSQLTGGYLNGLIDEYRISNVARWTNEFSVADEPYTK